MSYFIDDVYKSIVIRYQHEEVLFEEVEKILCGVVYRFPATMYCIYDPDIAGDFYLYIMERLPKILLGYKVHENAKFITYLFIILKRQYINFLNSSERRRSRLDFVELKSDMDSYYSPNFGSFKIEKEIIDILFEDLPKDDIIFIKLFSPDTITPEDCSYLSEHLNIDLSVIFEKLCYLFESLIARELRHPNAIHTTDIKLVAEFLKETPYKVTKRLNILKRRFKSKIKEGILNGMFE